MDGDWWYKCIVIVVLLSDSVFNLRIGDLKPNANTCTCWSTRYKGYTVGQDAEVNTHSTLPRGTVYLQVNDCTCTVAYNINVFTCKQQVYVHTFVPQMCQGFPPGQHTWTRPGVTGKACFGQVHSCRGRQHVWQALLWLSAEASMPCHSFWWSKDDRKLKNIHFVWLEAIKHIFTCTCTCTKQHAFTIHMQYMYCM